MAHARGHAIEHGEVELLARHGVDAVRATLIQSWGQLEAAKAQIIATQAQVQAAEIAFAERQTSIKASSPTT